MSVEEDKWYVKAFEADYLQRYSHRDQTQAALEVDWMIKVMALKPPGILLLDACCGQGRHMQVWRERGFDVLGFDLSKDLLKEAGNAVVRADQRSWPFADDSLDLVTVMFSSVGYFEDDTENCKIFEEMSRCLKPGGRFLVDTVQPLFVRNNLVAESEKELAEGKLVEKRRSSDTHVFKEVKWYGDHGLKEYEESLRLFDKFDYQKIFSRCSLNFDSSHNGFSAKDKSRMILLGSCRVD
jgi:SAM-dependent methyltransferase